MNGAAGEPTGGGGRDVNGPCPERGGKGRWDLQRTSYGDQMKGGWRKSRSTAGPVSRLLVWAGRCSHALPEPLGYRELEVRLPERPQWLLPDLSLERCAV